MGGRKRWIQWVWLVGFVSWCAVVTAPARFATLAEAVEAGYEVGQRAPDFTLPQLDGEPVNLDQAVAQHDVTLLYFFFAAT